MFKTKAVFERKPIEFYQRDCVVEKVIRISDPEFEQYSMHPISDQDFIQENIDLMFSDNGVYHCLLILGENNPDGILVEAEGYNYARYAAFLPNARILIEMGLQKVADQIIKEGTVKTLNGNQSVDLDKLEEKFNYKITEGNGFGGMLLDILKSRSEVSKAEVSDNRIDLSFYLDLCHGIKEQDLDSPAQSESATLRSLCEKLMDCVDHIIQNVMESDQKEYIISYEKVSEETGINVEFNDVILSAIHEMLLERPEISALESSETDFHLTVSQQMNTREKKINLPRLRDLLACEWEDLHLVHDEIDNDPATIVELSNATLTEAGRAAWADVLNAKVKRIFTGIYGTQMELTSVTASRLDAFSHMLAGCCSVEDYGRWVAADEKLQQQLEQSCSE